MDQRLTAILPCNDLDAAQAFFERLGFRREEGSPDEYRMMSDGRGGFIHLNRAVRGWLQAGRNPFGLYLYGRTLTARGGIRRRNDRRSSRYPLGQV
jgi:catechol 2,3-dioxygenase-like lactoylglutathione lyase family enzyme